MSEYTIDKCERFVSQRAGCGKAARPEFCEGCTIVRGAPTRPMKDILPEGRTKPWGTGQAVLVAKKIIKTPSLSSMQMITMARKVLRLFMSIC